MAEFSARKTQMTFIARYIQGLLEFLTFILSHTIMSRSCNSAANPGVEYVLLDVRK